jgi:putative selenium metabolism hydrolase
MNKKWNIIMEKYYDEIVLTASQMIQIKSASGKEEELANYTVEKMKSLGYDEVNVDEFGNVIGVFKGTGGGKSIMLNCHLDVVYEGDPKIWKYPPYSGKIAEGAIWGRGASDTKGTFAIQVYTPYILKKENLLPKGDIYVVGVVHEEDSGYGSMMLAKKGFKTDYAIVGEATENDIAVSARGRVAVKVSITGKSCHASIPHEGINPFDFLGKFLVSLKDFDLGTDSELGISTMSPTQIYSSEKGTNIIPNNITLILDYRSVPVDTNEVILQKIRKKVEESLFEGINVEVELVTIPVHCYTGHVGKGIQGEPPYRIYEDKYIVQKSKSILEKVYGHEVKLKHWPFATDSGHFSQIGVDVIGFSPAQIKMCHTTEDRINLSMLK